VNQPNVQKISVERQTDAPMVCAVTRSGNATGNDRGKSAEMGVPGVRRAWKKPPLFDHVQERETFLKARREFTDPRVSSSQIPKGIYQNIDSSEISQDTNFDPGTLRNFLESYMKLVRDQNALAALQAIISNCDKYGEGRALERDVNRVRRRLWSGGEMRITV